MRHFGHWTPRYIKNRMATLYYEKTCPEQPWLTRAANEVLCSCLRRSDIGLEFGSGRSTLWFAKRVAKLTSVEHDEVWAVKVQDMLSKAGIRNVDYRYLPRDAEAGEPGDAKYVRVIEDFEDNSLDFCLVDGIYREFCALRVVEKIRPGGLLIIDNVNWYLSSDSYSPNSRSLADGPQGPIWQEVETLISGWRRIWTSSGVTDTALFLRPCNSEFRGPAISPARR